MLKKLINNKYKILEILLIFIITLFYNLICSNISGDEIWNYGFSYNISNGLIPYEDFNMIITPLFPFLGALFLSIFGKSFLIYYIFNTLICTSIFYILKKQNKYNSYIIYLLILINSYPSYNLLSILLLYILILFENKKTNDYIIGIIIGLTFLTKQNIGLYLFIPTLFTKNIRKIFKRTIGILLPNLIFLIYLLITNSIKEFIDYTILGLFSFTKESSYINPIVVIIFLITTIHLIYKYIKTKDIKVIYIIMFQLLLFPMNDKYHVLIAFTPVISYITENIKIHKIIPLIFSITYVLVTFTVNIITITNKEYLFPNDTKTYTYKKLTPKLNNYILKASKILENIPKDVELFLIYKDAYLIKLEASIKINKYDLLNNGNLGKEGEKGFINDIENTCNNKKCLFLLEIDSEKTYHYAKEIKTYIQDNYPGGNIQNYFVIYKNY